MKDRIKNLRQDNDLTQQQLANYLKISRSSYRDIENNKNALNKEIIEQLVLLYLISFEYLLGLTNKKEKLPEQVYVTIQLHYNLKHNYLEILKSQKKK